MKVHDDTTPAVECENNPTNKRSKSSARSS